ncbi:NAD(P)-dependent oxidoreductase [Streptomyces sp. ODS05-4]|uniref:NAD(P)-dependent oxidoreductase n=1 Tax=Streptomyces sp. ODS05-4 TaxID=2944939 RepID=UPI00210AF542|nr:NAD(P)-dependent oxidoreductase [Streptomyces sp. ODS05-4]
MSATSHRPDGGASKDGDRQTIALLHPGRMGTTLGAQLVAQGHRVLWWSTGRSAATRERAEQAGFAEIRSPEALGEVSVALSIAEPSAAADIAQAVAASPFRGVYVDANAGRPDRIRETAALLRRRGSTLVDGCVIGNPQPADPGPRLYLAGPRSAVDLVTRAFGAGPVGVTTVSTEVGAAKALKSAYASHQKTAYVLALLSLVYAERHGVREALLDASRAAPPTLPEVGADVGRAASVVARAWRWAPELVETADELQESGVPGDLASAAGRILARWDAAKDQFDADWERVLTTVLHRSAAFCEKE